WGVRWESAGRYSASQEYSFLCLHAPMVTLKTPNHVPRFVDAAVQAQRAIGVSFVLDAELTGIAAVKQCLERRIQIHVAFAELAVLAALQPLQVHVADDGLTRT